jgi:hypothetical protein
MNYNSDNEFRSSDPKGEVIQMATELKRMTFAVTPDMEELMDEAKRMFYDSTQSEMIRALIVAGLAALKTEKEASKNDRSA